MTDRRSANLVPSSETGCGLISHILTRLSLENIHRLFDRNYIFLKLYINDTLSILIQNGLLIQQNRNVF